MYPVVARFGPITIYAYGTMLATAFVAGLALARYEFRRRKINPDFAYDFVLVTALGGIVFARLFYVLGHWDYYGTHLSESLAIWQGGLVFYGGLAGGILGVLVIVHWRRLSLWTVADALAAPLALGIAIGRVGCLLNGCCYGVPSTLPAPIAFTFAGVTRYATQLYELVFVLGIFLFLFFYVERRLKLKSTGSLFLIFLWLYGFGRFWFEFVRESPRILGYFTFSQVVSFTIVVGAGYVLARRMLERKL